MSNAATYTPGSWQMDCESDSAICINADLGRTWKHIAVVKANGDGSAIVSREEMEANARLIAAAPDLLAACERCIMALAANGAPNCEAAKEARAAIVKATIR